MTGYKRRKLGADAVFDHRADDCNSILSYNPGSVQGSTQSAPGLGAVFVTPTVKQRHRKSKEKQRYHHQISEQDEASSINAAELSDFSQIFEVDRLNAELGATGGIDSEDSAAAIRKSKNREAAKISRQKKKAETEQFQARFDRLVKENNKLKLDNAALRAENSIIKRQLNYFENLFAKKTSTDSG